MHEGGHALENDKLAEQLRADPAAAGLTRRDLHESGGNTRKMRTHDLRGTFVTLSRANGRNEAWVQGPDGPHHERDAEPLPPGRPLC